MTSKTKDYVVTHAGIMNGKGIRLAIGHRCKLTDDQAKAYVNKVRLAGLGPTPDEKDVEIELLKAKLAIAEGGKKGSKKPAKANKKAIDDADKKAKAKATGLPG